MEGAGKIAIQQFKWIRELRPEFIQGKHLRRADTAAFFAVFFSGLSFKIACSLLAHLFSINVSWTATSKEVHKSNFFLQVPVIFKQFWGQMLLSLLVIVSHT
jgi:hypothetical protein